MKFISFFLVGISVSCFLSCFYEYAKSYAKDHAAKFQTSYYPYYELLKDVFPIFSLITVVLVIMFVANSDLINPSKSVSEGRTGELVFDAFGVVTAVINYVMILKVKQEKTAEK